MDENKEKKTCGFIGTVTISTEEYRDFIESSAKLEAELKEVSKEKSDYYWKKYSLENELKELKPKYEKLVKFLNEADGVKDKYRLWKIDQEAEDE